MGLMTTAEAAAQLGVSRGTVRSWVTRYRLERVTWGGHRYFVEREILELDRDLRARTAELGGAPRGRNTPGRAS